MAQLSFKLVHASLQMTSVSEHLDQNGDEDRLHGIGVGRLDPGLHVKARSLENLVEEFLILFAQRTAEFAQPLLLVGQNDAVRRDSPSHTTSIRDAKKYTGVGTQSLKRRCPGVAR